MFIKKKKKNLNYKSAALSDYNVQGVIELHLDLSYLFM